MDDKIIAEVRAELFNRNTRTVAQGREWGVLFPSLIRRIDELEAENQRLAERVIFLGAGEPYLLHPSIAKCPECGAPLEFQFTAAIDDFEELVIECTSEKKKPDNMRRHRWLQGEWQPVFDKVRSHGLQGASLLTAAQA